LNSKAPWRTNKTKEQIRNPSCALKNEDREDAHILHISRKFSISKARKAQILLSKRVKIPSYSELDQIRLVAGFDVAYWEGLCFSAAAVMRLPDLKVIEEQSTISKCRFPYIPTLLAYRECGPVMEVMGRLKVKPDAYIFNGHGLAHPFGLGLASHLGVVLGIRSIGVARKPLNGVVLGQEEDMQTLRVDGKTVGIALELKRGSKPVYVSVGNLISLQDAVEVVRRCTRGFSSPEPLRRSHQIAARDREARKQMTKNNL